MRMMLLVSAFSVVVLPASVEPGHISPPYGKVLIQLIKSFDCDGDADTCVPIKCVGTIPDIQHSGKDIPLVIEVTIDEDIGVRLYNRSAGRAYLDYRGKGTVLGISTGNEKGFVPMDSFDEGSQILIQQDYETNLGYVNACLLKVFGRGPI